MRQLDASAKRAILQELLNNHLFRGRDFDRCYEASLFHDGGRVGMYGETVVTGLTYSERVRPFVSLIAPHYGYGTPETDWRATAPERKRGGSVCSGRTKSLMGQAGVCIGLESGDGVIDGYACS